MNEQQRKRFDSVKSTTTAALELAKKEQGLARFIGGMLVRAIPNVTDGMEEDALSGLAELEAITSFLSMTQTINGPALAEGITDGIKKICATNEIGRRAGLLRE